MLYMYFAVSLMICCYGYRRWIVMLWRTMKRMWTNMLWWTLDCTIGGTGVSSIWTTPSLWLIYRWERNARYEYLFLPFCKFEMITYGLSDCHIHSVYKYYWWNCFYGNRMQPRTTTNRRMPSFPSRLGRVPWSVPCGGSWTSPHGRDPSTCPRWNQPRKSSSASVQVPPSPCLFLGLTCGESSSDPPVTCCLFSVYLSCYSFK